MAVTEVIFNDYLALLMMTNQKNSKPKLKRGRPKTNPLSRPEQLKLNSKNYRIRQAQKRRYLKHLVNEILIPNIATVIDQLENRDLTKNQRMGVAILLLKKASKQWDQEILSSRLKDEVVKVRSIKTSKL